MRVVWAVGVFLLVGGLLAARLADGGWTTPAVQAAEDRHDELRQDRQPITVTARLKSRRIWLGARVVVRGTVSPAQPGTSVRLQRRTDSGWRRVATAETDSRGSYVVRHRPRRGGRFVYRVRVPSRDTFAAGRSPRRHVTVRAYAFPVQPAAGVWYGRDHHDYPATDIFDDCGTAIVAPTAGRVDEVSRADLWDPKVDDGATRGGRFVSIVGSDGVRYYASHLKSVRERIEPGARVRAGERIGRLGKSGSARPTPCHLHFGISPPCGHGDWAVRRGVIWPWRYLDAWKAGDDRSPARRVREWAAAHPRRCPGGA